MKCSFSSYDQYYSELIIYNLTKNYPFIKSKFLKKIIEYFSVTTDNFNRSLSLKTSNKSLLDLGISEFSISIFNNDDYKIRLLSEVNNECCYSSDILTSYKKIGNNLFSFFTNEFNIKYDCTLFNKILEILWVDTNERNNNNTFRAGFAFEFSNNENPTIKSYFDFSPFNYEETLKKLSEVFQKLNFSFQPLLNFLNTFESPLRVVIVGIDFSEKSKSLKIYLKDNRFTKHLCRKYFQNLKNKNSNIDEAFNMLFKDEKVNNYYPSIIGLVFNDQISDFPIIKLDFFLPSFKKNDSIWLNKISCFLRKLMIKTEQYEKFYKIISLGTDSSKTNFIHQFLSIDLLPNDKYKVNLYFRPIGIGTTHMCPKYVPFYTRK